MKKLKYPNLIFILILFISAMQVNVVQAESSKIRGKVTDINSGDPLPGANIIIKGTALGASANMDGEFVISNLESGKQTVVVSYIGYQAKEIEVELKPNLTLELNVKLSYVAVHVDEDVVVIGQAVGQMEAINNQISSDKITNIVSSDRIRELPDANAAESLGRLPGVSITRSGGEASGVSIRGQAGGTNTVSVEGMRMAGTSLDGNSRGAGLNSISSQMIDGIELEKSFTADKDADVIGGNITFKLKEAKSGLSGDVFLKQGYNGFNESLEMNDLALTIGNRFFDDKLGVIINTVYDRKNRGTDYFTAGYTTTRAPLNSSEIVPVEAVTAQLLNRGELRERFGFTTNIDYKIPNGKLNFNGFFNSMDRTVEESINNFSADNRSIEYNAAKYDQTDRNFLLGLSGEHDIFDGELDWKYYLTESLSDRPNVLNIRSELASSISPDVDPKLGPEELISKGNHNADQAKLMETGFEDLRNEAAINSFYANYKKPFNLNNTIAGYIKIGGKYTHTKREYKKSGSTLEYGIGSLVNGTEIVKNAFPDLDWQTNKSGAINYANFVRDFNPQDFGNEDVKFYYPVDFDKLSKVLNGTKDFYIPAMLDEAMNYTNWETYSAAYLMVGLEIGPNVTFIPGLRYEYNSNTTDALGFIETQGGGYTKNQGTFYDTSAVTTNDFLLPMINLKVKVTDWFDIRAAATKTLVRPGFQSYSPRYSISSSKNVSLGNTNLKPQTSDNYDLYLSLYDNYIGLFTAGGFYKKFENQVFEYNVTMFFPEEYGFNPKVYKNKDLTMQINNKWDGFIHGFEFDWQTHFWYLPKPFDGLVLNVNYTHMNSETSYPFFAFETKSLDEAPWFETTVTDSSRKNKISGMPDDIFNLSLGYENGGFSGRVSLYYQGFTITNAQVRTKSLDANRDKLIRWDVQLSQKIIKGLKLYVNLNNLTDWPDKVYLTNYSDFKTSEETYGWSGDIGLRYEL